jgi:hypothetical protein
MVDIELDPCRAYPALVFTQDKRPLAFSLPMFGFEVFSVGEFGSSPDHPAAVAYS